MGGALIPVESRTDGPPEAKHRRAAFPTRRDRALLYRVDGARLCSEYEIPPSPLFRAGMVGVGMIFEETYWPMFQQVHGEGCIVATPGPVEVELAGLASRTGSAAR